MERYMIHLENKGYLPQDSRTLVHRARDLCRDAGASVRVCRVATGFVELDVSVDSGSLERVKKMLEPIGRTDNVRHVAEEDVSKDDGIRDGILYYNGERFWEAHEAWEGAWKKCRGPEKSLVQGLILLAVSFAHRQKNDEIIGIGMLSRAAEKIGTHPSPYHGIDIDRIRDRISQMQQSRSLELFTI